MSVLEENFQVSREDGDVVIQSRSTRRFLRKCHGHCEKTKNLLLTYDALTELAGSYYKGEWSKEYIGKIACLSERKIFDTLNDLEKHGIIHIKKQFDEKGHRKASLINIIDKSLLAHGAFWVKTQNAPHAVWGTQNAPAPHAPRAGQRSNISTLEDQRLKSKDTTQSKAGEDPGENQKPKSTEGVNSNIKSYQSSTQSQKNLWAAAASSTIRDSIGYLLWSEAHKKALGIYPPAPMGDNLAKTVAAIDDLTRMSPSREILQGAVDFFFCPESHVMNKFKNCRSFHYFIQNISKFLPAQTKKKLPSLDSTPEEAFYVLWDPRHPKYLESRDNAEMQKSWESSTKRKWVPGPSFEEAKKLEGEKHAGQ